MLSVVINCVAVFCLSIAGAVNAQTASGTSSGYVGYNLTLEGDQDSVIYSTESTRPDANVTEPDPDVYLNAAVHVGEIDIEVDNLTAKINLDLEVLQLLSFSAGVDVSIDRVKLTIQDVTAKVLLEARLENILLMVNDTLNSIDLNPIIATLGNDVSQVVNTTVSGLSGSSGSSSSRRRSLDIDQNILYSVNDYTGNAHTNRILAQNGDIIEQELDNHAQVHSERKVGSYDKDMRFNGHEENLSRDGELVQQLQYVYAPFHGLSIVAAIYLNDDKTVVATEVLTDYNAGGSSTISDL